MTDDPVPEFEIVRWEQTPAEQQESFRRLLLRQEAVLERRRTGLPTAQQTFALMVKKEIAPRFRELGFEGSGQKFRLPSDTHILAIDFQRSAWNDILEVQFTINLSANVLDSAPKADEAALPRRTYAHRDRLGFVARGHDYWWRVPAGGPTLETADEVIHDVREFGVPWLRRQTKSDFAMPWLPERARG